MTYEIPPNRPKLNGKKVPVSTYVDEDLYDALVVLARSNEHGVAAEIRIALRSHLEKAAA